MSTGLRELQPYDMAAELERAIVPVLAEELRNRGPGHCMRVSDLDLDLMVRLCGRLRSEAPGANIFILAGGLAGPIPDEFAITSTKLVELRNPKADGTQRPPLLVFLPSELRTAAEDSFGVATFEELRLGDAYTVLCEQLLRDVPPTIRGGLTEGLNRIVSSESPWPFADQASIARLLLTGKVNGGDSETYGAALYEIGLVPDFELFAEETKSPQRLVRNRDCVAKLTWSSKSERGRVLDLDLSNRAFRSQLGNFLADAGLEDPRAWTKRIVLDPKQVYALAETLSSGIKRL